MTTIRHVALGTVAALAGHAMSAAAQQAVARFSVPEARFAHRAEPTVMIPSRDGTLLATDLYVPVGIDGPVPTILLRTPYDKTAAWTVAGAVRFAGHGYAVAIQDVRGKYQSGGRFAISGSDRNDGYDTVDWIIRQPWSNGKVGTYGCSYLGETQLTLAATRHPAHAAMVPQAASNVAETATIFKGGITRGGAIELSSSADWLRTHGATVRPVLLPNDDPGRLRAAARTFTLAPKPPPVDFVALLRTLPLVSLLERMGAPPTDWERLVSTTPGDSLGRALGLVQPDDRFDTPALFIDSWYDYGPANTLRLMGRMQREGVSERTRANTYAVIGPTTHCAYERASERTIVGHRDVGDARYDFFGLYLAWFDRWLRDNEQALRTMPKLQLYVMGRNTWRGENEWPLARTAWTPYYLRSDGRANGRFGSGVLSTVPPHNEPPDRWTYDPATPVPSLGGPDFGANNPALPPGALDQRPAEARHDVLVYTTPPLERGVEVTGPIRLVLYVSSDARDTDFTGKLVDVYPDGRAFNVQEGILRARYRSSFDRPVWLEPGQVHEIEIDLEATSNYFAPGHRIRLEISSSNFPRFDRNLNTGGSHVDETSWRLANNAVHHSSRYPSRLVLPVIPDR